MKKINEEKIKNALTEYNKCYEAFSRSDVPTNAKHEAKKQFVSALKKDIYPLLSTKDRKIFENFKKNSTCNLNQLYKIEAIIKSLTQKEKCPPRREKEMRYFQDAYLWKVLGDFLNPSQLHKCSNLYGSKNIRGICFGYAFEIFYKILILMENEEFNIKESENKEPDRTHKISELHNQLHPDNQREIEEIIKNNMITEYFRDLISGQVEETTKNLKQFLEDIDKISSPQRRYYQVEGQRFNEQQEDFSELSKVLDELQDFVIQKDKNIYPHFIKHQNGKSTTLFEVTKKQIDELIDDCCKTHLNISQ